MPVLGYITFEWPRSPRVILVGGGATELLVQDLVDTIREAEDELENLDDYYLIDAVGKTDIGGGSATSITVTLLNAVIQFADRTAPDSTGGITTGDNDGRFLIDAAADFIADGILVGATVYNETDHSLAQVVDVVNLTTLETRPLTNGIDNDYDIGDTYRVHNVDLCVVRAGNVVAVDDLGDPMDPLRNSLHTYAELEKATSGALLNPDLNPSGIR
jgi:hypothetical protein